MPDETNVQDLKKNTIEVRGTLGSSSGLEYPHESLTLMAQLFNKQLQHSFAEKFDWEEILEKKQLQDEMNDEERDRYMLRKHTRHHYEFDDENQTGHTDQERTRNPRGGQKNSHLNFNFLSKTNF